MSERSALARGISMGAVRFDTKYWQSVTRWYHNHQL